MNTMFPLLETQASVVSKHLYEGGGGGGAGILADFCMLCYLNNVF